MRRNSYALVLLSLFIISGCSSDDDNCNFDRFLGGDPSSCDDGTAEGLWHGTTNTGRALSGVAVDDGTYWFIYSLVGNSAVVAGVAQGNATSSNGSITSSNGLDFNFEGLGVLDFTLEGTYEKKRSLDGSITYSGSTVTFTSSYDTDYDLTPSLTDIAGTYTGSAYTSGGLDSATVTFTDAGAIAGIGVSGCTFSGSASPRANGNIYNVSVTFDGLPCANGTDTVTGVAYFDTPTKQLTSVGLNSGRTDGFIYVGIKP
jgi:hypothetical protein